ncbi:hypothetical protein [uncultured Desulfobacter sp.]|uniref:hypothetical protein n=1 Tax=uncultured Desulfobacter sp. TaxID=240139 RepID=UPI0029F51796|nr:hypothetical protein [uncultured Desulfobacter sp.]
MKLLKCIMQSTKAVVQAHHFWALKVMSVSKNANDLKRAFFPVDIIQPVQQWVLPFATADRRDIKTMLV